MNFSTRLNIGRVFAGAKFTIKNPRDIAARMLSSPKIVQTPVERKSPPSPKERTLPSSFIRFFTTKVTSAPKMLPAIIEPKISFAIFSICIPNDCPCPPSKGETTVDAIAYKISATASSIATIPRVVVVKGPRVLNSFKTSVVAAGAVAEHIAPRISPKEIAVLKSFIKMYATKVTKNPTTKNGVTDSPIRIPTNCLPYFFITSIFSSAPIKNPIKESAIVFTGFNAMIVSI